jgi:hypothetical protein
VTVRAFDRMLLNEPWVVTQAAVFAEQVRHQPTLGARHLMFEFDIDATGGLNQISAWVFLKVSASAPATVTKPICPSTSIIVPHGTAHQFSCSLDADCQSDNFCQMPRGFCDTSPFTEPPMARTVTVAEMWALGFGVEPRTGNEHATFRVIWEDVSVDNPFRQCPVSFDDGRTPTESVAAVLNCTTRRLSKAQASFDMFNEIKLNPPWVVDFVTVTEFQATTVNSTMTLTKPVAGDNTLTTRVRLKAKANEQTRAAVSIRIKPAIPDPLPCFQSGPSFCTRVADCPSNAICSAACGSRCVLP